MLKFFSTGMSTMHEISDAVEVLIAAGTDKKKSQFCIVILNILRN